MFNVLLKCKENLGKNGTSGMRGRNGTSGSREKMLLILHTTSWYNSPKCIPTLKKKYLLSEVDYPSYPPSMSAITYNVNLPSNEFNLNTNSALWFPKWHWWAPNPFPTISWKLVTELQLIWPHHMREWAVSL